MVEEKPKRWQLEKLAEKQVAPVETLSLEDLREAMKLKQK